MCKLHFIKKKNNKSMLKASREQMDPISSLQAPFKNLN